MKQRINISLEDGIALALKQQAMNSNKNVSQWIADKVSEARSHSDQLHEEPGVAMFELSNRSGQTRYISFQEKSGRKFSCKINLETKMVAVLSSNTKEGLLKLESLWGKNEDSNWVSFVR